MKNLIFLFFLSSLLFISCSEEQANLAEIRPIDNITVTQKDGSLFEDYQYDVLNKSFIGDAPQTKSTTINGTLIRKERNSTGGHNYYCILSSSLCYSNEQ